MPRPNQKNRGIFERPLGSGTWYARWTDHLGVEHRQVGPGKTAAQAIYTKAVAARMEGRQPVDTSRLSIADLIARYEPEILSKNKKSAPEYARQGKLWTGVFGPRIANRLTAGDIETWSAARQKTHAAGTVNLSLRYLKMLFNLAIRDDILEKNPLAARRVKEVKGGQIRERILTSAEEDLLEANMPRPFWLQLIVALYSGLRQAEQLGLKRAQVSRKTKKITLHDAKGDRKGEKEYVGLNDRAWPALEEAMAEHPESEWVWPNQYGTGPIDGTALTKKFQRLCRGLGMPGGITWHALRHTFISRLCMMGVPLPTVQKLARHRSITMTLRYAHLCPDHQEQALQQLCHFKDAGSGLSGSTGPSLFANPNGPATGPCSDANTSNGKALATTAANRQKSRTSETP